MFKKISKIQGVQVLNKSTQKGIQGGFYFDGEYGECPTPNSFFCGVPDHICCNGLCVLPEHPACGLL
ncbi:hypothetical protein [uncultured Aquimarina sp.]|uniref:hypothetical protein n=1 Tax=uncultured Aquimarina sp. TaxID=575652 RepID=UPI0026285AC3|nr:hypothetical protein [uncultured Aquimarina sp.]